MRQVHWTSFYTSRLAIFYKSLPQICTKYQMPYLLFTPNHII